MIYNIVSGGRKGHAPVVAPAILLVLCSRAKYPSVIAAHLIVLFYSTATSMMGDSIINRQRQQHNTVLFTALKKVVEKMFDVCVVCRVGVASYCQHLYETVLHLLITAHRTIHHARRPPSAADSRQFIIPSYLIDLAARYCRHSK